MIRCWVHAPLALHHSCATSQAIHDLAATKRNGITNRKFAPSSEIARKQNYATFGVISAEHGHNVSRMGAQYGDI
jgi:hypothetical protein